MLFRSASLPALPHKVNDPESKRYIMASYHQKAIILPWWSRNLTYTVLEALKMVFPEFKANKKSYNMEFILIGFISYFLCINLRDRRKGSYRLHSSTKAGKKKTFLWKILSNIYGHLVSLISAGEGFRLKSPAEFQHCCLSTSPVLPVKSWVHPTGGEAKHFPDNSNKELWATGTLRIAKLLFL